jgi:23S rRNA pseudouridine2605 synthase
LSPAGEEPPVEDTTSDRVQKRLAAAGVGSRRAVDQWVAEGRVRVNGRVAAAGTRIRDGDRVRIDGRRVFVPPAATCRLLLYHKPPGEVTTRRDPEGRRTVFESLPRLRSERWVSVGRLDINTSGLMLFATHGELAHRLMHPRYRMEREYAVRILGRVEEDAIRRLQRGVDLDDGPARFLSVREEGGEGANRWYRVVLEEGRNREVHRLWESQGVRVSRLIRVRVGPVRLPSVLRSGTFMDVPERERAALFEAVALEDPGPPAAVRRRAPPRGR